MSVGPDPAFAAAPSSQSSLSSPSGLQSGVEKNKCACGAEISRWSVRCLPCLEKLTIATATTVEPSAPLNLVCSETFYYDLKEAIELDGGRYAHPCDEEPLAVNVKRLAECLEERIVEDICEEAFEDAEDHLNGRPELLAALEAALEAFNAAQTSCVWTPRTKEVFLIPALAAGTQSAETSETSAPSVGCQSGPNASEGNAQQVQHD